MPETVIDFRHRWERVDPETVIAERQPWFIGRWVYRSGKVSIWACSKCGLRTGVNGIAPPRILPQDQCPVGVKEEVA